MNYIVYKITNVANGKIYIGMTRKSTTQRLQGHIKESKSSTKRALCKAIQKHGEENFKIEVLKEFDSKSNCEQFEDEMILQLKSMDPAVGYNMIRGGHFSSGMSGKKHSDDTIKHFSKLRKGKKRPEHQKAMKKAYADGKLSHLVHKGETHPSFNKPLPQETKDKLSAKMTGRKQKASAISQREATKAKKKLEGFKQKRLNDDQVRFIRSLANQGMTIRQIHECIGKQVSTSSVKAVVNRNSYKDIE